MELPAFVRTWHGIDLAELASEQATNQMPAGPEFYSETYSALEDGRGKTDDRWIQEKLTLGNLVADELLEPWARQNHRRPRILALCSGAGVAEGVWLERGYHVTLHECQATSLRTVCTLYAEAGTLICDIRQIAVPPDFDVTVCLASEYFLSKEELLELMRKVSSSLRPNGLFVLHSVSALSVRQWLAEMAKKVLGRYRTRPHVFWGWWRTPSEFCRTADHAGLTLAAAYTFGASGEEFKSMRRRLRIFSSWPTFSTTDVLMVFRPSCGR